MSVPQVSVPSFVPTRYGTVTPSDSVPMSFSSLYIGGAGSGNLSIVPYGGTPADAVAFAGVGVGFFPVSGSYVMATGTDVTDILWLS